MLKRDNVITEFDEDWGKNKTVKDLVINVSNADLYIKGIEISDNGSIKTCNCDEDALKCSMAEDDKYILEENCYYETLTYAWFKEGKRDVLVNVDNSDIVIGPTCYFESGIVKINLNKDNMYRLLIVNDNGHTLIKDLKLCDSTLQTNTGSIEIVNSSGLKNISSITGNIGIYGSSDIEDVSTTCGNIEISGVSNINTIKNDCGSIDIFRTNFTESSIISGSQGVNIKGSLLDDELNIDSKGPVSITNSDIAINDIKIKCKALILEKNRCIKNK